MTRAQPGLLVEVTCWFSVFADSSISSHRRHTTAGELLLILEASPSSNKVHVLSSDGEIWYTSTNLVRSYCKVVSAHDVGK